MALELQDDIGLFEDAPTLAGGGLTLTDDIGLFEEVPEIDLPEPAAPAAPIEPEPEALTTPAPGLKDDIGILEGEPEQPALTKVTEYRGAEIFEDREGNWFSASPDFEGVRKLPEEVKAEVEAETGGLKEPRVDPTTVGLTAAGVSTRLAYKAGARGIELLGRAAASGIPAAAAEYPIGVAAELVGEAHPKLALPVNIALGVLSGVTIERAIEKALVRGGVTPTAKAVAKLKGTLKTKGVTSEMKADDIAKVQPLSKEEVDIDLPKYARSVNLEKQKIDGNIKKMQVDAAELRPKKVQTWDETGELASDITKDYAKTAKVIEKAKKGEALVAEEIEAVRQTNVNAINRLKEISETSTPEQFNVEMAKYENDVFTATSNAANEAGRALNIHKKEISPQRLSKAFLELKRGLNERELKEFKSLNLENPLEVKRFVERLGDPKFKDYFYEYWYNSILSGIPTHMVNVASNTAWSAYQIAHRPVVAGVDALVSKFTGRPREVFLRELAPMMGGYKTGWVKGAKRAEEVVRTNRIQEFETKWNTEIGNASSSAFERSPHKGLRKIAPLVSAPTRALRAMDVWANSAAFDAQLKALSRRRGLQKGLEGTELATFEKKLLENPTQDMLDDASEFAKHSTFMDAPGPVTRWVVRGRDVVPGARLVVPFVNTISNLMQRGVELTPGVGLALAKGKRPADVIAKQIEGSMLTLFIMSKIDRGEITGRVPENRAERESFYRQGKQPWAMKLGDNWVQYRRVEPFNTPIAMVTEAHRAIKTAGDEDTATQIFGDAVEGVVGNLIDSSYMSGLTNLLDRYGRRKGMAQRLAASLVPFSSFWRSIGRAHEALTEGSAKVRDVSTLPGAFSQVIPGLKDLTEPKLNVWGKEIEFEGGMLRQWLPYKWSTPTDDPVEKELERLGVYPSVPGKNVTIKKEKIELPDDIYRNYAMSYGNAAYEFLRDNVVPSEVPDTRKTQLVGKKLSQIRRKALNRAKKEYIRSQRRL